MECLQFSLSTWYARALRANFHLALSVMKSILPFLLFYIPTCFDIQLQITDEYYALLYNVWIF